MPETQSKPSLQSRVLKTEPVSWRSFQFIQQEEFKDLPEISRQRLRASILANDFTQPFYVWQDPESGVIFCLDGKHRCRMLEELSGEGYDIPDQLPGTFIFCKDKSEAAKLVLIYSSIYAKITQQGLFDFLQMYELGYDELRDQVDLPDFSVDRFE